MIESRFKACLDRAKELLGIAGEWRNVRGFRNAITSGIACKEIPRGSLERKLIHYCQAISYVWDQLYDKLGLEAAEEFKTAALFALYDDVRDYKKKLDEIKEKKALLSKEKTPLTEAPQTTLQEAPEEAPATHAEQTENKDVARNVVKRNVVRTEKAEKRRKEILDLLKNNQNMTYENLAAIFGCDKLTVYRDIQQLKSSGRLRHIGDKSTGHWEVTEE